MIKSRFELDRISVKLGISFARFGLTPNTWTVLALLPALAGFIALYHGNLLVSLILFIISGAFDAVDGSVARVTGSVTELGAFLDGVIDRYVEILLYIGLFFYLSNRGIFFLFDSGIWIILLVYGAIMPSFIRAYADHRGVITEVKQQRQMGGLLERAERLTLLYAGMLAGLFEGMWLMYVVVLAALLANLTAFQRIIYVLRKANRS